MTPVVLDTDVVSFLFKNDTRAQAYFRHLLDRQWLISFMTEAELEQWALLANWQAKRVDWLRIFFARCDGLSPQIWAPPGNCRCLDRGDRCAL